MKSIQIEDDVYGYLLKNAMEIGESASSILRRLLGISGGSTGRTSSDLPKTEISDCLSGSAFKAQSDVVGRFLCILSFIYRADPEKFKKVLDISGKRRKYFALSKKELEDSGRSVYPKQIPSTPAWVITNNDTPKKRRMLQDVMHVLGYSNAAITQAVEALV